MSRGESRRPRPGRRATALRRDAVSGTDAPSARRSGRAKSTGGEGPSNPISSVLSSFTTSRPVAVFVLVLAAGVFGYFSLEQLPMALMPELSYPTLTVRTEYPGAAPEEVENDISRPVEEALGVIGGLERRSSVSRAGVSDVVLEFSWDTDMSEAAQETLEKLDLVFLPPEAEQPLVLRYDPSLDPVLELSLSGSGDRYEGEEGLRRLRRLAELEVKRGLESVAGVAAVRVRGGLEEEIHVRLDEERVRRTGLPVSTINQRLAQENVNVAGGTIKEGRTEYMVRTLNEYENLGQIEETVLSSDEGRDVRVRDVGEVVWSHKEREILTRTDGETSVQIDIYKEADANIVALAKRIQGRMGVLDLEAEKARAEGTDEDKSRRGFGPPGQGGGEAGGLAVDLYRNEGAVLEVVADRSIFIESSLVEVRRAALFGGFFAIGVLFLFLRRVKPTLIVAVSIPISLLITFAPLGVLDVSLNIMSLGGLALGIGMLVDSSIVVLESIFRCREEGDDLVSAAVRGTAEVRGAVIASTLTSIAVFLPMIFVEGIAGQAFGDLGLAVVMSLLASLAVAVFLIPMLASRKGVSGGIQKLSLGKLLVGFASIRLLRADVGKLTAWTGKASGALGRLFRRLVIWPAGIAVLLLRTLVVLVIEVLFKLIAIALPVGLVALAAFLFVKAGQEIGWLQLGLAAALIVIASRYHLVDRAMNVATGIYRGMARWALAHSLAIVALVFLILGFTGWTALSLDTELLPEVHQGEITFEVALPVGTPLEETEAVLAPVEAAILENREHIESLILTVGYDAENSQRSDEGEHTARFKVLLESSDPRVESSVADRLRDVIAEIPDAQARMVRPVLFSSKTPIEVEIFGDDLARLKRIAEEARSTMAGLSQLSDVEVTLKSGAPEVQIVYDRDRLSRYDLNIRDVATLVRDQVKGFEATKFNLKDRRVPVLVRLGADDRESVTDVEELLVNPGAERPIPLAAVADITLGEGPSEVRRIDSRRAAVVSANIAEGSLGSAVTAIESEVAGQIDWPADMTFFVAGQNEEWEKSQGSLILALALSIFLVYVIMAAQFESLLQPFVIMFTIPLAFFGSVALLALTGTSLSIVVFLGMIMLAGIVVNNAIVLIDYINILRRRGMAMTEAVIEAGAVRLRPILMTTATTVLGLAPMALGLGDGAEIRTPMALAVIGGLVTSTLLTLIVIPSIYAIVDRFSARITGRDEELADEDADEVSNPMALSDPEPTAI